MGETTNKTNIGGRVDLAGSDNATYVIGQGINERLEAVAHKPGLSDHAETTAVAIGFEELLKDVELLKHNIADKVVWHFFRSGITGKIGPTPQLKAFIKELVKQGYNIRIIIHRFK